MARQALIRSGDQLVGSYNAALARRAGLPVALARVRESGWKKAREEGRCRMCQRPQAVRPLTRHHIVPRHWFREHALMVPLMNADSNIVPLCVLCHQEIEKPNGLGRLSRVELRRLLACEEATFACAMRGADWFDGRYPRAVGDAALAAARVQARRRARERRAVV